MNYKSPYPWFGGKSAIMPDVWQRFGNVANFVDPFFGSNAALLSNPYWTPDTSMIETINDADGFVCNFWRAVAAAPDEVAHYADWPINECVPSGTMIATPTGEIPVENIYPGMTVLGDKDGVTVLSKVVATKRSRAREFYNVDDLFLTGNHPVWTSEAGYVEARRLASGMHIKKLRWPVCENDLVVLQFRHEQQAVGNLYTDRSENTTGSLCRRDVSQKGALQGAHVARRNGRKDTPGLLDTVINRRRDASNLSGDRGGTRGRMAGGGTAMDCSVSTIVRSGQSYRWRRRFTWLYSNAGFARKMVKNAGRRSICARSRSRNERENAFRGGKTKNQRSEQVAKTWERNATKHVFVRQEKRDSFRTTCQDGRRQSYCSKDGRIQTKRDCFSCSSKQTSPLCRNWRNVFFNQSKRPRYWRKQGRNSIFPSAGYTLQRLHAQTPVTVYNFQTTTGNYYANRILVHNCDQHARHVWLVSRRDSITAKLEGDPDYYDAKVAGWWVWGMACWIGSGWCSGNGPWQSVDGELVNVSGDAGQGIKRQRVQLGDAGRGVNRKLVHLGDAGQAGAGEAGLYAWMNALQERLRRVRVCCGDWARVCGPTPTVKRGLTAVFLDPPYSLEARRDNNLYAIESGTVAHDVRKWAIENGDNPLLRIALCGYDVEHAMPDSWEVYQWKAHGGYGSQGNGAGRDNASRECVWFSPNCLRPNQVKQSSLFEALA